MITEFTTAFQDLMDAAEQRSSAVMTHIRRVFQLADDVSEADRTAALDALAPVIASSVPGLSADLSILAGSLVEKGTPAGSAGIAVLEQLSTLGKAAGVFLYAWEQTGQDAPPDPDEVSQEHEERVAAVLGELAEVATTSWWVSPRFGLAAKTMLTDAKLRAHVRADPELLEHLTLIAQQLASHIGPFGETYELLRMAAVDRAVVLDRASGRGFRVRFDGVGDNFQLHTLLAQALIAERQVPGDAPDPSWVAAATDGPAGGHIVHGVWDLVGGDGSWVGNEALPADLPVIDGDRVLILEPISLPHSWRSGRRHPHLDGRLTVTAEVDGADWWPRVAPPGTRHPLKA
jgi:hypothetical protein